MRTRTIEITLPELLADELECYATSCGITESEVVARLLRHLGCEGARRIVQTGSRRPEDEVHDGIDPTPTGRAIDVARGRAAHGR